MALRPVFFASDDIVAAQAVNLQFTYYPGFSDKQKLKSVKSLHTAFKIAGYKDNILEVSTYSDNQLGVKLSAFNLIIECKNNKSFSVESAFQASKVFEFGGPYSDILGKTSREAKSDERLRNSGKLIKFQYINNRSFPLMPRTFFYSWLYINALAYHKNLADELMEYSAFTDIAFNPEKSINCQAEAVATFVSLKKKNLLERALMSEDEFCKIVFDSAYLKPHQLSML